MAATRTPYDIGQEMATMMTAGVTTVEQVCRYRELATQMLATRGTTALDAMAFATIAAGLVGFARSHCPQDTMAGELSINESLASAVAFLGETLLALETATGVAYESVIGRPHLNGEPPTLNS